MDQTANSPLIVQESPLDAGSGCEVPNVQPHGKFSKAGEPFRFSSANARLMAAKSIEARRAKHNPPASNPLIESPAVDKVALRVARIDERIEAIIDEMEGSESAKDTQALAMALDRLCGVWSLLTGHPRPGVRKDTKKRGPTSYAQPQE